MNGVRSIGLIGVGDHGLHRLDPRLKIIVLLCLSLFSVLLDQPWSLAVMFAATLVLAAMARAGLKNYLVLLVLLVLSTWGLMFSQAIFYYGEPRTVLFSVIGPDTPLLGPLGLDLNVYREGFEYGAIQSLRFSSMITAGLVFVWTTDAAGMLRGLIGLRVPYLISFMVVTAINFLPTILDEVLTVRLALSLRGGRIWSVSPWRVVMNSLKVIRPVFINCYRRSNILALSVQSRAFSVTATARRQTRTPVKPIEVLAGGLAMMVTASVLAAKTTYWLFLGGVYYNHHLRPLYDLCRNFL